jgi:hypothetical protein
VDDRFFNAFLPPSVKICGRRLDRFTLWHQLLLAAIDSPILTGTGNVRPADVLAAAAILRARHPHQPAKPGIKDAVWHWAMCRWPDVFEREAIRLIDWMRRQSSQPIYYHTRPSESTGRQLNSGPQCLSYKVALMSKGGFSESQAWDMPMGQALWEVAQLAAQETGDICFLDEDDVDDAPVDISAMSEEAALAMFRRDLPASIVEATFNHWREHVRKP